MTKHPSRPGEASGSTMDVPEVVIAQAEAAASTNQAEYGGLQPESAIDETRGPVDSKGNPVPLSQAGESLRGRCGTHAAEETPIEQLPQVVYGPHLGQVDVSQDGFDTKAKVAGMALVRDMTHLRRR